MENWDPGPTVPLILAVWYGSWPGFFLRQGRDLANWFDVSFCPDLCSQAGDDTRSHLQSISLGSFPRWRALPGLRGVGQDLRAGLSPSGAFLGLWVPSISPHGSQF